MYLPKALKCKASVTLWFQVRRIERKKWEKAHHNPMDIGIREEQKRPSRKTDTESYYTGAERVSGLHDLLSCHHRPNKERIQVPMGDISQAGEGRLG